MAIFCDCDIKGTINHSNWTYKSGLKFRLIGIHENAVTVIVKTHYHNKMIYHWWQKGFCHALQLRSCHLQLQRLEHHRFDFVLYIYYLSNSFICLHASFMPATLLRVRQCTLHFVIISFHVIIVISISFLPYEQKKIQRHALNNYAHTEINFFRTSNKCTFQYFTHQRCNI